MKHTENYTADVTTAFAATSETNVMEGVPSRLATVKAVITERQHILTRRSARRNRRLAH